MPQDARPTQQTSAALAALIEWYMEAGVDIALDEAPHDHLAGTEPPAAPARPPASGGRAPPPARPDPPAPVTAVPPSPAPSDAAVMAAREAAASAADLDELKAILARFEGCNLRLTATNLVFADGRPGSRLMLVGEAPGREEDLKGLPFVGRSGQLLDRILAAIGLDRDRVYIANVIPWRPPGNRKPTPLETEICRPFIERQIALANPDVLVCLGDASARQLLRTEAGILRTRGRWFDYDLGHRVIRATATLHPAYLLRNPIAKRLVWRDFLAIRRMLEGRAQTPS